MPCDNPLRARFKRYPAHSAIGISRGAVVQLYPVPPAQTIEMRAVQLEQPSSFAPITFCLFNRRLENRLRGEGERAGVAGH